MMKIQTPDTKTDSLPTSDSSLGSHAAFIRNLSQRGFSDEDIEFIDMAYDQAKFAHRNQERAGGERYFEHVRAVANHLLDSGATDRDVIIAALLHDVVEDQWIYGSSALPGRPSRETAEWRLHHIFGPQVATSVLTLTEPEKDGRTKGEVHAEYMENLSNARFGTILVKLADRLHNLSTLEAMPIEKQIRKIHETESDYLSIFARACGRESPVVHSARYLYAKVSEALCKLRIQLADLS